MNRKNIGHLRSIDGGKDKKSKRIDTRQADLFPPAEIAAKPTAGIEGTLDVHPEARPKQEPTTRQEKRLIIVNNFPFYRLTQKNMASFKSGDPNGPNYDLYLTELKRAEQFLELAYSGVHNMYGRDGLFGMPNEMLLTLYPDEILATLNTARTLKGLDRPEYPIKAKGFKDLRDLTIAQFFDRVATKINAALGDRDGFLGFRVFYNKSAKRTNRVPLQKRIDQLSDLEVATFMEALQLPYRTAPDIVEEKPPQQTNLPQHVDPLINIMAYTGHIETRFKGIYNRNRGGS